MGPRPEDTGFYRILIAIETDATRYYGARASRPRLLEAGDAEQLLAHVAADLNALLPGISGCSLIAAGALFDQTQVLQPQFPVFSALESVAAGRDSDAFKTGLISIGARDGRMPLAALQPLDTIPLGLLQLLPVLVHGPAGLVAELGDEMEYRFLEEGQLSAHSAAWLEPAFGITVNHARLMTLTDLNAMLRLQLEHFGVLPLWELLDAALTGREEPFSATTGSGQVLEWKNGAVHIPYETFDYWASRGGGSQTATDRQALAEGYGALTRENRQYLTTLKSHGVEVRFHLPGDDQPLQGTYFAETSAGRPAEGDAAITEHSHAELGTIAITVAGEDRLENYYPLSPQGLNDVHSELRRRVAGGHTVAFPGSILYDEKTRRLIPDSHG
jgi:hypothetical protein